MRHIVPILILLSGCTALQGKATFEEANDLFHQGKITAALDTYQQILERDGTKGDRVLFEMGVLYAHPGNDGKDYRKSLECFQKLIREYPSSGYRQSSQTMVSSLVTVALKDETISAQQKRIESLQQEIQGKESEIAELNRRVKELEQSVFACAMRNGPADRIVIEKKARRLLLTARGKVIKTYRIALGGDPIGPKEREGDTRTPEGTYVIDSRNRDSRYHRSLHISYPNERDRKRAQELGVPPGGDIMIHGLKKGFSRIGDAHAEVDWTQGCIAVTDEEIEEIDMMAPNGTIVEIRP